MQYMLLIYEDEAGYGDKSDSPEIRDITARHMALVGELGSTMVSGAGLMPTATATTVRTKGGKQTKEQLGGYYLIEAPDLDAAIAIAKRVPLRVEGAIEVRPLIVH